MTERTMLKRHVSHLRIFSIYAESISLVDRKVHFLAVRILYKLYHRKCLFFFLRDLILMTERDV